ncbi:MAG: hypothetical protein NT099_03690 [Candidatus Saganbacteria bacterium]|nr:hypothetical protein [Candidatus Saganbacteria bacterium]
MIAVDTTQPSQGVWRALKDKASCAYRRAKPYLIPILLMPIGMAMGIPSEGGVAGSKGVKFGKLTLTEADEDRILIVKAGCKKGIHVGPSMHLNVVAEKHPSIKMRIHTQGGQSASLNDFFSIPTLQIKQGHWFVITFDGENIPAARQALRARIESIPAGDQNEIGPVLSFAALRDAIAPSPVPTPTPVTASAPVVVAGQNSFVTVKEGLPSGFSRGYSGKVKQLALGPALVIDNKKLVEANRGLPPTPDEETRFEEAVAVVRTEFEKAMDREATGGEGFTVNARNSRLLKEFAAGALKIIATRRVSTFEATEIFLREFFDVKSDLAADMKAIMDDVILARYGRLATVLEKIDTASTGKVVLVVSTLTPLTALYIAGAGNKIAGVVSEKKLNPESHQVLLLDNAGVAVLTGIPNIVSSIKNGDLVVIDTGENILLNRLSEKDARLFFSCRHAEQKGYDAAVETAPSVPEIVRTLDGREISLVINSEGLGELADGFFPGIGLFRTEFSFMRHADGTQRTEDPSMPELIEYYMQLLRLCSGKPVTIRTFDFSPSKCPPYLNRDFVRESLRIGPEGYLLYDGTSNMLRFESLNYLFRKQIRAFLIATGIVAQESGEAIRPGMMFPMISSAAKFNRVLAILEEEKARLRFQGEPFFPQVKIGTMIELPTAVREAAAIARQADFLCLGTNDLKAALSVEFGSRDAEEAHGVVGGVPPRLLQHIAATAKAGETAGKLVSCCGALASSLPYVPLLVGAGVRGLSVSKSQLGPVAFVLQNITYSRAEEIAMMGSSLGTTEAMDGMLTGRMKALIAGEWKGLAPLRNLMLPTSRSVVEIIALGQQVQSRMSE